MVEVKRYLYLKDGSCGSLDHLLPAAIFSGIVRNKDTYSGRGEPGGDDLQERPADLPKGNDQRR